jgi:hypothetical protein
MIAASAISLAKRRLRSRSLTFSLCFVLCACGQQLSSAQTKALEQAKEYWGKEGAPCVLANNCRVEVRDEGGKWLVLLSRGEGVDSSSFVTSIDKTTGEIYEAYWVVA